MQAGDRLADTWASNGQNETQTRRTCERDLVSRFVDTLIRHRFVLLLLYLILTGVVIVPSFHLRYDRSVAGMFHAENKWLLNYQELRNLFGELDTCVIVYSDPNLISVNGLRALGSFSSVISDIPGVHRATSLAHARRPSAVLDPRPLADQLEQGAVTPSQLRAELLQNKLYNGTLLGPDGRTAAIIVTLAGNGQNNLAQTQTIQHLRRLAAEHQPPAYLAGENILVNEVFDALEQDGRRLTLWTSLLLVVVVWFLFWNVRWVLLPLAVVFAAIVWTKALLVVLGAQLSMVSSPLDALITVIGVATVIHVAICFREERATHDPFEAMRRTLRTVGPAVFWTCLRV